VENAGCSQSHAHPRGQLIYASSGVMKVICENDMWIVPSSQAVWVPSYTSHEVYFPGKVTLANLFTDPSVAYLLPDKCSVIKINSLLKQLISVSTTYGNNYKKDSSAYRLMMVLIDQITEAEVSPLHLPVGRDPRLLRVIENLRNKPSSKTTINELSQDSGASSRTVNRLFLMETGLTFQEWRTRLLLQNSLELLDKGYSISDTAIELQYNSVSSFIEMFKRNLGKTPGEFIKEQI
ncbi:MAG: helix-turn-helix transcriptional regulator, partial [Lentisphaeraceae bacterium]|nr:helix-turn-helix transcriptional regulator [Lentisphaeraceae bacterium]